jgi:hypothetical protein
LTEWRDLARNASYNLGKSSKQAGNMGRLLKYLFILCVLGGIALVVYAYIGPFLGADFSPQSEAIRQKVTLDAQ